MQDCATVLRRLGAFFRAPGNSVEPAESLNVEASLWGATSGVGTANFVLDPQRGGRSIEAGQSLDPIVAGVQKFLTEELPQQVPDLKLLRPPQVGPASLGPEARLFAERFLGEVRFGAIQTTSDPARDENAARLFGAATQQFASRLRALDAPICYLFSPTTWTEHRPRTEPIPADEHWVKECWWLRIGFGLLNVERASLSEVQALALEVADEVGLGMAVYEPDHWAVRSAGKQRGLADDLMSYHFVPIVEPDRCEPEPHRNTPVEGITIASPARPGLLADILSKTKDRPLSLYGVSMGVIFGHLFAHFVVRQGQSSMISEAIDELASSAILAGGSSAAVIRSFPFATDGPSIAGRQVNDSRKERFWIAWRCPERPGVLSEFLECIHREIAEELGTSEYEDENIVYEVSRLLASGNTYAGKMAFVIDREIAAKIWANKKIEDSGFGSRLRDQLIEVALPKYATSTWELPDGCEEWRDEPVVVTHGEPAADPWGKLSLLAGGIPGYSEPT